MKRRTAGVALGSLLVAGVVAGAVLSPGYVAVQPELDGSSVWVANGPMITLDRSRMRIPCNGPPASVWRS